MKPKANWVNELIVVFATIAESEPKACFFPVRSKQVPPLIKKLRDGKTGNKAIMRKRKKLLEAKVRVR